jgi:hypothetical protein
MIFILTKHQGKVSLEKSFKTYTDRLKDGHYQLEIRKKNRSDRQNRALHLYFRLLADELNDDGYEVKKTLRQDVDIPWTGDLIKEFLWRPLMKTRLGIETTTKLKTGDIDTVYEILNKVIGERCGVSIPFPSKELTEQYYQNK